MTRPTWYRDPSQLRIVDDDESVEVAPVPPIITPEERRRMRVEAMRAERRAWEANRVDASADFGELMRRAGYDRNA